MASFRGTVLVASVDGTQASVDITSTDLAGHTPKGAIIFGLDQLGNSTYGVVDSTLRGCTGFVDDAGNQVGVAWSEAQAGTSNTNCAVSEVSALLFCSETSGQADGLKRYTASVINNGIRLTKVVNTGDQDFFVQIVCFAGDDVSAYVTPRQTGTGPTTGIPFTPTGMFSVSGDFQVTSGTYTDNAISEHGFGMIAPFLGVPQEAYVHTSADDGQVTGSNVGWAGTDGFFKSIVGTTGGSQGNISATLSHTSFAAGQHNYSGYVPSGFNWYGLYLDYPTGSAITLANNMPTADGLETNTTVQRNAGAFLRVGTHRVNSPLNGSNGQVASVYGRFVHTINPVSGGASFSWGSRDAGSIGVQQVAEANGNWRSLDHTPTGFELAASNVQFITDGYQADWSGTTANTGAWYFEFWFDDREGVRNMYYGADTVDNMKYGSADVDRVYYGGTIVWQRD